MPEKKRLEKEMEMLQKENAALKEVRKNWEDAIKMTQQAYSQALKQIDALQENIASLRVSMAWNDYYTPLTIV